MQLAANVFEHELFEEVEILQKVKANKLLEILFSLCLIHDIFRPTPMSKKKFLLIVIAAVFVSVVIALVVFLYKKGASDTPLTTNGRAEGVFDEKATPDVLYEDPAGFSIMHSESITVEDVTPEDEAYYAQLNLTKGGRVLTIIFMDTEFESIEQLLEENPDAPKDASLAGATSMAEISMDQYTYTSEEGEMFLTAGIDQGVLYLIEGSKDGGFWEDTQNMIVSTFTFLNEEEPKDSTSSGADIVYEAEEVIE